METGEKKPVTLYLDLITSEMLETYCYLARRNKTRVMNEAIRYYLSNLLKSEYEKQSEEGKEGIVKSDIRRVTRRFKYKR